MFWSTIARLCHRHSGWLIQRAKRAPYRHITDSDGRVYMERYWLFNPYETADGVRPKRSWWRQALPSIRLHRIMLPDDARHLHDHPWNARTIILDGWYVERRPHWSALLDDELDELNTYLRTMRAGDTAQVLYGQYHRIEEISAGGVWTMFITWKYRGTWGFYVNGRKIGYQKYLDGDWS